MPTNKIRTAVVASEYRAPGESTRFVGANGEINASSKSDLLQRAHQLQLAQAGGAVETETAAVERASLQKRNRDLLQAAFRDPQALRVLGERLADDIYMTSNRKGVARRFMNKMELKQGDIPRFPVRLKNAQAVWVSGPTRVETEILTDKWLMPPELQLVARLFVPQNEINQSNTDVLEEKYVEGLEAIMVAEDRMWYNLVQASVGIDNSSTVVTGTLSPTALMNVRQRVARWNLKAAFCYMASDLFVDIVGDSSFIAAIEPVARHELVMTGSLATLYGLTLISEAYRHPEHKVLSEGEFIIVSDPITHGAYSDRGGIDSQPLDQISERVPGKGWLLSQSWAAAIANARSVATAVRL